MEEMDELEGMEVIEDVEGMEEFSFCG